MIFRLKELFSKRSHERPASSDVILYPESGHVVLYAAEPLVVTAASTSANLVIREITAKFTEEIREKAEELDRATEEESDQTKEEESDKEAE
jgi:hypothetical protein